MNNIVFYSLLIIVFFCIIVFIKDRWGEGFETNPEENPEESVEFERQQFGEDMENKISYRNMIVSNNVTPENSKLNIIDKLYKFNTNSELWINSKNSTEYNFKFVFNFEPDDLSKGYTIVSGKYKQDIKKKFNVWSLVLRKNSFILNLDKGAQKKSKLTWDPDKKQTFEIMISYKIKFSNHSLNCYIAGELLQMNSTSSLDYNVGHTVIFGSEQYPIEAYSVGNTSTTNSITTLQPVKFINFNNDFIANSFPNKNHPFPHSIGDIDYETDFKTVEQIKKKMSKESVVCKYDPRYDSNTSDCISKCQANDACNLNICETICKSCGPILPNETKEELEPDPPTQIRLIPHNNALEIQFRKPKHQGLDSKIDKYIVMAKLKFLNDKNKNKETKLYTFNVFEEDFHKFTLNGLLNNQFYDISVLSHNENDHTSKTSSETQTQAPVGDDDDQTEDDIPIQEYCYNPEYKFKSNIIDSAIVSDMYKDGKTFDATILNAAGVPLTEENERNWKDDSAVQILSDLQNQFSFI